MDAHLVLCNQTPRAETSVVRSYPRDDRTERHTTGLWTRARLISRQPRLTETTGCMVDAANYRAK